MRSLLRFPNRDIWAYITDHIEANIVKWLTIKMIVIVGYKMQLKKNQEPNNTSVMLVTK